MVATRASGLFGVGGAPNVAILVQLQKRYPIDSKRVYLVGYSMGAGDVLSMARETPERFAGAAALGGGGAVRKAEAFTQLPLFIGCGKANFALTGACSLAGSLKKVKGATVTRTPAHRSRSDPRGLPRMGRKGMASMLPSWQLRRDRENAYIHQKCLKILNLRPILEIGARLAKTDFRTGQRSTNQRAGGFRLLRVYVTFFQRCP